MKITHQSFHDPEFQNQHRVGTKDFSRKRTLTFSRVAVLLLQKTVRSIQLHLHDFLSEIADRFSGLTPSAWTQARAKFKHTAFIEINKRAILEEVYRPQSEFEVRRWLKHRLLAIDSSLLRLPNEQEIGESFGWVTCENQKGQCGRYAQGRLSVLSDVLNHIAVDSRLVNWKTAERRVAADHLLLTNEMDVVLLDRGYGSYDFFAAFSQAKRLFVCRCSRKTFGPVNALFAANQEGRSVIVELTPPNGAMGLVRERKLPEKITIRFVTVRLSTGELEVLATNLLEEQEYPAAVFGEVYALRWEIETYYGLLKGRLHLENFTGRTIESVLQDVHAAIFLSNLETVVTRSSNEKLQVDSASHKHPKKVNHAVSFHALKSRIVTLLLSNKPIEKVLPEIEMLFLKNPISTRQRQVPRQKTSAWRSYHYQRTERKAVF